MADHPLPGPGVALRGPIALRSFGAAGVLDAGDMHIAARLCQLGGDAHPDVLLAAALAVRGLRMGHVCVDLDSVDHTVSTDLDHPVGVGALNWPPPDQWIETVARSDAVALGDDGPRDRALRLRGSRVYLDRYWREERQVAVAIQARIRPAIEIDPDGLQHGLDRLFPAQPGSRASTDSRVSTDSRTGSDDRPGDDPPDDDRPGDDQRRAAATAVSQRFAVIAGGPGTGKTTTVARVLALFEEQAEVTGSPAPRIALTAPTGRAAARLEEAVHAEAAVMPISDAVRARLLARRASTLHRLLGWRPDSQSRFRYNRHNHLPHAVVIVDETSMVSLSMMAKLVEALAPDARLVLVGDPEQLASVEAGTVLGDIVGPAGRQPPPPGDMGDHIVVLRRVHRFAGRLAQLSEAIQRGDADAVVTLLGVGGADLQWLNTDRPSAHLLEPVRREVVAAGVAVQRAAEEGDGREALAALAAVRVLCGHREGPAGVTEWTSRVGTWLSGAFDSGSQRLLVGGSNAGHPWYVGRPLLVTENDYELQLYNGDTGVVIDGGDGSRWAVFQRQGVLYRVGPSRLGRVETLHAITVHKSQGGQFEAVVVVLPPAPSPLLTRELLYTAVTRAQRRVTVVGTEASVRTAVSRPIGRASGLAQRLWA